MNIAKYILGALLLSALLALPVSSALSKSQERLKQEQKHSKELRLQVDSLKVEQRQDNIQFDQLQKQHEETQKENEDLKKKLQAKRDQQLKLARQREAAKKVAIIVSNSGDCSLVNRYDWDVRVARAVCLAESSGIVSKVNMNDNHGSCRGSYSLMQVGCFWYPFYGYSSGQFFDPNVNVAIAYKIWQRSGQSFNQWTAYTSGAYVKYL